MTVDECNLEVQNFQLTSHHNIQTSTHLRGDRDDVHCFLPQFGSSTFFLLTKAGEYPGAPFLYFTLPLFPPSLTPSDPIYTFCPRKKYCSQLSYKFLTLLLSDLQIALRPANQSPNSFFVEVFFWLLNKHLIGFNIRMRKWSFTRIFFAHNCPIRISSPFPA